MAEAQVENVPQETLPQTDNLDTARKAELARLSREENLRRELEDTKRKLETVKRNGWDIDILSEKKNTPSEPTQLDSTRRIDKLEEELAKERAQRNDIEEMSAIIDFTNRNPQYELVRALDDAPKYIRMAMQQHLQNTGKHLSYAEACDYVESEIERAEIDRVSKFSKTKKAEKIYQFKSAVEQPKATKPTVNTPEKTVKEEIPTPPNFLVSNSRDAFNFLRNKTVIDFMD